METDKNINASTPLKIVKIAKVPGENYYTVLYELSANSMNYIGEASFKKQNGVFKSTAGFGFGVGALHQTTITVGNDNYNVIYGVNKDEKVKIIRAEAVHKKLEYVIRLGDEEYFVHYKKLPHHFKIKDMYPTKLSCYDKDNKLIPWQECER